MLELIIISVLLLLNFLAVAWYARLRSQRRSISFEEKTRLAEPPIDNEFGQYLDEQLARQQEYILGDVNEASLANNDVSAEPGVTLSPNSILAAEKDLAIKPKPSSKVVSPPQTELDLTEAEEPYFKKRSFEPNVREQQSPSTKPVAKDKEWDIVLALTVIAADDTVFKGYDIASALNYVDLDAGEMHIFHRYLPGQQGQTLFSVANLLAPGTLKPDELMTLETQGLVVFMRIPSPANGLLAFDAMLDAADKIAKRLNGQLKDEHRQTLTESTLENMRSRILSFNLTQQLDNHQFKHDYSN